MDFAINALPDRSVGFGAEEHRPVLPAVPDKLPGKPRMDIGRRGGAM